MQTHQPDIFKDKNERQDFFIALLIIALAAIFITQTSLVNPENDPSNNIIPVTTGSTEDSSVDTKKAVYRSEHIEAMDHHKNEHSIQDKRDKKERNEILAREVDKHQKPSQRVIQHSELEAPPVSNNHTSVEKADIIESLEEDPLSSSDAKEELIQVTSTKVEVLENISTKLEEVIVVEEDIRDNKTFAEPEIKRVLSSAIEDDNTENNDCVIAVGLYQDALNVSKLTDRLKSQGFNVFTKNISSMTQVGIYISCDPTISKSVLSEVKEIYARDAFIIEKN